MFQCPPLSLYVHTPWCLKKCPYCDFNSHQIDASEDIPRYVDALLADLTMDLSLVAGRSLETIFIGGGTPSLFPGKEIGRLLQGIESLISCAKGMEVTLEVNPGAVETDRFEAYREAGVNRLSIGIQSFDLHSLRHLERIHGPEQAIGAVHRARSAGFDCLNLDLMFGLPEQSAEQALQDVRTALQLQPEHISYYQLTLEPNTRFAYFPPALPEEDTVWEMQSAAYSEFSRFGFSQYELSAFSRPEYRCRHNLNYWSFGDYIGIGAGAHGKISDREGKRVQRRWRVRGPKDYLDHAGALSVLGGTRELTGEDRILEFMMNLFRLREGFTPSLFESRTGMSFADVGSKLSVAEHRGLIRSDQGVIRCTELGRRFLNDLLALFA